MKKSRREAKKEGRKVAKQITYHACTIKTIENLDKPVDNLALLSSIDPAFAKIYEARKADK